MSKWCMRLIAVAFCGSAVAVTAEGAAIGVNFAGGGGLQSNANTSLTGSEVAGVVPQSNYNNVSSSSVTNLVLFDDTRTDTTALLTLAAQGTSTTSGQSPFGGDERLNTGTVIFNGPTGVRGSITQIPASYQALGYSVYLYVPSDFAGRVITTTLTPVGVAPQTFTSRSIAGGTAGHVDGSGSTPYAYSFATTSGGPANVVRFTNLKAASFTFETEAPVSNLAHLSGIQIVQNVPEPTAVGLAGLAAVGLLARRSRRA